MQIDVFLIADNLVVAQGGRPRQALRESSRPGIHKQAIQQLLLPTEHVEHGPIFDHKNNYLGPVPMTHAIRVRAHNEPQECELIMNLKNSVRFASLMTGSHRGSS